MTTSSLNTATEEGTAPPLKDIRRWFGLSKLRYGMLAACILAQTATILITWPLWQVREAPVHLPAIDLPQIPFGVAILATLLLTLVRPRIGWCVHVAALLLSFVFDQFRTQPQVIANAILMAAALDDHGLRVVRWFLASLWCWAGLHKLLSPDWFTFNAWSITTSLGLDPSQFGELVGWGVGLGELTVGLLAIFWPRGASIPAVLMHVGIALFLTPLAHNWNYSVIPWNLCVAVVGGWVMWTVSPRLPQFRAEWIAAVLLLLYPAGFYVGWVDHGIASVLYSGGIPDGLITTESGSEYIDGWGDLRVPFPNERRLLRQYFARSAPVGAKLHIADTRTLLGDLYYVKRADGQIEEITQAQFFASAPGVVAGIALDDQYTVFRLGNDGATMLKRAVDAPIYAVQIDPSVYQPEMLPLLARLHNLEQLNLAGCPVTDEELARLPILPKLQGIGLANTTVTDVGLQTLLRQPKLDYVEGEGSAITSEGMAEFLERRSNEIGND
ncbi:MauE/DoxX family redox-associated membrane protein [Blastopirellula retiformator]|uniref:Methylamine utilisation protein MauE domain-containing protein n=1 Tax=Blastopirellula retiformator TaxID=2527970 RepID=A0A5C5VMF7_9BACT|nr:MauE/DoxX family redox-associated membrane protein [Blastopirellula retiformator]TWT39237.1 hypothetical protein Enr8_09340 [Blastopirellula retiformator]